MEQAAAAADRQAEQQLAEQLRRLGVARLLLLRFGRPQVPSWAAAAGAPPTPARGQLSLTCASSWCFRHPFLMPRAIISSCSGLFSACAVSFCVSSSSTLVAAVHSALEYACRSGPQCTGFAAAAAAAALFMSAFCMSCQLRQQPAAAVSQPQQRQFVRATSSPAPRAAKHTPLPLQTLR